MSDTPQELPFLATLQHLMQIDPSDPISDVIWDTVEKLVCRATLLEKKEDSEKLLMSGYKRLEKAVSKDDVKCTCNCHKDDGDGRRRESMTLSPVLPRSAVVPPPPPPPGGTAPPPPPPPPGAPPPPPGGAPGVPPPPPGPGAPPFGAPLAPNHPKLPQQQTPKPKSKMRKLQWNKIPNNKVLGGNNVWTKLGSMFNGYKMNYDKMEELFSVNANQNKPSGKDGGGDPNSPERKKKDQVEQNCYNIFFIKFLFRYIIMRIWGLSQLKNINFFAD